MRYIDFVAGCKAEELSVGETNKPPVSDKQVLVNVEAFGINRADLLQRAGKYPAPPGESAILGLEVAGTVVDVGSNQRTRLKVGDRVFGLVAGGGYAQYVAVNDSHLIPTPDSMNSVEAAAVAECFLTAYQTLFVEYNLTAGQSVLIHAGASGVGLAAIQLAKQAGCQVAVTASSAEKLAICQTNGADLLINYKTMDFVEVVRDAFKIDLVVDFVGADYVNRNLAVLNMDGCIVQLAMLGGPKVSELNMGLMLAKRAVLKASTLRSRSDDYKTNLIHAFQQHYLGALAKQTIRPNLDHVFKVSDIALAHTRMENNLNSGKLVCYW